MRYLETFVRRDLASKMVFLSGPRQAGKTTLAKSLLTEAASGIYLNWDDSEHRKAIRARNWKTSERLLVLDEIHKMPRWKVFLKGTFDTQKSEHQFLVTGSARLEVFKRGGDSLLGRYLRWRLHPFCLAENPLGLLPQEHLQRLLERGGFPEPYLHAEASFANRWKSLRLEQVIREDLRDLERVREISLVENLTELLRSRVGNTVVFSHLAQDLEVAPKTVKNWIAVLERLFLVFVIKPYSKNIVRSLSKAPKVYFYNFTDSSSEDPGARFENLVACHLLKRLQFLEDLEGRRFELSYLRDKEGHEVDFVILENRKPVVLIEAKVADEKPSKGLIYFAKKFPTVPVVQVVQNPVSENKIKNIRIVLASQWLSQPLSKPLSAFIDGSF